MSLLFSLSLLLLLLYYYCYNYYFHCLFLVRIYMCPFVRRGTRFYTISEPRQKAPSEITTVVYAQYHYHCVMYNIIVFVCVCVQTVWYTVDFNRGYGLFNNVVLRRPVKSIRLASIYSWYANNVRAYISREQCGEGSLRYPDRRNRIAKRDKYFYLFIFFNDLSPNIIAIIRRRKY